MEKDLAQRLVWELERHPPLTPQIFPDRDYFIDLLVMTAMPPSERFYEVVKPNQKVIPDPATDQTHVLSVRRVLRNGLAGDYKFPRLKKAYEDIITYLGIHDSNIWTRRLRTNRDIVDMMIQSMVQSEHPYSLLAKLETYDELSNRVSTRPLLIIPDAKDLSKISAWENANTLPYLT